MKFACSRIVISLAFVGLLGAAYPRISGAHANTQSKTALYVTTLNYTTGAGSVAVYHAYGNDMTPIKTRTFTGAEPYVPWTDTQGNVYVPLVNTTKNHGHGFIGVFAPGLGNLIRVYTSGLSGPGSGTFDSQGNMYVSNLCGPKDSSCSVFARTRAARSAPPKPFCEGSSNCGYVAVFPPSATQPSKLLINPLNIPVDVAVDADGDVFAADNTGGAAWQAVRFPAGSTSGRVVHFDNVPSQRWVGALAFNPRGSLLVSINNAVYVFPRESGHASTVLTAGIAAADGLAYGPDGSLFAGNFFAGAAGNIVVFPPGATSPTRTYTLANNVGVIGIALGAQP